MSAPLIFAAIGTPTIGLAQDKTAREAGINVAEKRGYPNSQCYADVFVKTARLIDSTNGKKFWQAKGTPAFNEELLTRCGIDRVSERKKAAVTDRRGARRVGALIASQRGFSGKQADCFARVFTKYAVPAPEIFPGRPNWIASAGPAFKDELKQTCDVTI